MKQNVLVEANFAARPMFETKLQDHETILDLIQKCTRS